MREDREPGWTKSPAAQPTVIAELVKHALVPLPAEYLDFLTESNGGEGELGRQPGWFVLWRAEDVIEFNQGYEVASNIPGHVGFGSSGGGELFAFDTRAGQPYPIVTVPFIPMNLAEARPVAASFSEFRTLLGKVWDAE